MKGKVLVLFLGLVFGFFALELGLRFVGVAYPNFWRLDPHCGVTHRPNTKGWYILEGKAYVEINSLGLRNRELTKQKGPDTFRIAIVGDSLCEALNVPLQDTFWRIMETRLPSCLNVRAKNVEVISFAVSGYGTGQELQCLRNYVWAYTPDLVLVVLSSTDVRNNSRPLNKAEQTPYFVFKGSELVLDDSFRRTAYWQRRQTWYYEVSQWLLAHSRVYQVARMALIVYQTRRVQPTSTEVPPRSSPFALPMEDNPLFYEPTTPEWKEAWRVTEGILKLMKEEADRHHAPLLLVYFPVAWQVHPDPSMRKRILEALQIEDFQYPARRLSSYGASIGLPVLDLGSRFLEYSERNRGYLFGAGASAGFGHPNPAGHRAAADEITAWVCERVGRSHGQAPAVPAPAAAKPNPPVRAP